MNRQSLELEARNLGGPPKRKRRWDLLVLLSAVCVAGGCYAAYWYAYRHPAETPVEAKPPWWIIDGIVPEGPEEDGGGFKMSTFSAEQQTNFGIDKFGKILNHEKWKAAIAAAKLQVRPPWWILSRVKPEGPMKGTSITFSVEQQKHFGV